MTVSIGAFSKYIVSEIPSLPDQVADEFVVRAARELCEEAYIWQQTFPFSPSKNTDRVSLTYQLRHSELDKELQTVLAVSRIETDTPVPVLTTDQLRKVLSHKDRTIPEANSRIKYVESVSLGDPSFSAFPINTTQTERHITTALDTFDYDDRTTTITTATEHGLKVGDTVIFSHHSNPDALRNSNIQTVIAVPSATQFTINVDMYGVDDNLDNVSTQVEIIGVNLTADGAEIQLDAQPNGSKLDKELFDPTTGKRKFRAGERIRIYADGEEGSTEIDGLTDPLEAIDPIAHGDYYIIDSIINDGDEPTIKIRAGEDVTGLDAWVSGGKIRRTRAHFVVEKAEYEGLFALKPQFGSTYLPDLMYDEALNSILYGAFKHIYIMPNKEWTDPNLATYYAGLFESETIKLRALYENGRSRSTFRKVQYGGY